MIVGLVLMMLVAFAAWKTLFWLAFNFDRVARAGHLGARMLVLAAYAATIIALPAWAYLHPADDRALWVWAAYLVTPVLALAVFWLLSARKARVSLPLRF